MRVSYNMTTSDKFRLISDPKIAHDIDRITEAYARKMANLSASYAPVLNGFLRGSLVASVRREKLMVWTWGSNLPYARRQEYEHRSRKGFVRKAVWELRDDYKDAVARRMRKVGR